MGGYGALGGDGNVVEGCGDVGVLFLLWWWLFLVRGLLGVFLRTKRGFLGRGSHCEGLTSIPMGF